MKTLFVYTDGGALNNPGPAGIGVVVKDEEGKRIKEISRYIGEATNNQAEYTALIEALNWLCQSEHKKIEVKFFLDSELLVKQMNLKYRVKDKKLQPLFLQAHNLATKIRNISFAHISRDQNKEADTLVNLATRSKNG